MRRLLVLVLILVVMVAPSRVEANGPLSAALVKQIALDGGIRVPGQPTVLGSLSYEGVEYTFAEYQDGGRTGLVIAGDAGANERGLLLDETRATEVICRWNWRAAARGLQPGEWDTLRTLAQTGNGVRGGLEAARSIIGALRDTVTSLQNYQKNLANLPGGQIVIDLLNRLDALINLRSTLEGLSSQLVDLDRILSESSAALGRIVVDFTALRADQPVSCQQVNSDVSAALDILGKLQPRLVDVSNITGSLVGTLSTLEGQMRDRGIPNILISPLSGARTQLASSQSDLMKLNQSVTAAQNTLTRLQNQVSEQNRTRLDQWRYRPNPWGIPGLPEINLPNLPTYIWVLVALTLLVGLLFVLTLAAALRHGSREI